jgi:dienelactone hydrolase
VTNPYPDLERSEATYDDVTRTVFRGGTGPAVIVMHEIPGLYPSVVAFGRRVLAAGMTVYFPSLLGDRFERLREELGDRFIGIEIDSSPGNPYGLPPSAHSVVTRHLVDEPGHPTRIALDRVIAFFRERLAVA